MGVTLTVALVFWLASSYIEYKLIKGFPALHKVIMHPVGGIILSIIIGTGVTMFVGANLGLGVFIGQILGLATNQFTFKLYTGLAQLNTAWKELSVQLKNSWQQNKEAVTAVVNSFRALFKAIGMIFMVIIKILSIPGRIANFFSKGDYAKTIS